MLWIPFTVAASLGQVLRNGAQASLTQEIGTLGATQVRFIFGLPFALALLALAVGISDSSLPDVPVVAITWAAGGALCQIGATALMLVVMNRRSFSVAYAYIKTEPIIVAVAGFLLLGDQLTPTSWIAVAIVTAGVVIASVPPGQFGTLLREGRMIAFGLTSGLLFGLSAIAFRAAISAIPDGGFIVRSLETLAISLVIQSALLGLWLGLRDREAFTGSLRHWRTSLGAGALGAFASACWFCAFALTAAANVRSLGLLEMAFAAILAHRMTGKRPAAHEVAGLLVVGLGIFLLLGGGFLLLTRQ